MKKKKHQKSALSLHFNKEKDQAPKVTAKGKGLMAERIIELAREHKIPIKEDPDLVEVLSQVDVNQEVPPSVYLVVAELLAWVYKMNSDYKGGFHTPQ
ncbi:MAG: EscU/YscU/HrcU family type III secretion system export apparatus switch protein [Candidatus Nitronauta litoralis]|uniref:EscU/YscU/HrcU family type III secretion system export apparatus switch protein n=1 Tax=Candidatus Nitronauta litoralis TaxID=2705533 RepID=A0A7T0BYL3_9BACT|nr:MAG: EscU/YscU/HrcU family type III secretion system export apparatus switch protein [Candidatus Nitronauta litoralis]